MRLLCVSPLIALGACQIGVLHPRGPIGEAERTILINSLVIMLAIVIPTIAATLGMAWWFRASNPRARYRPDWAFSGQVEVVTWSIPILVILFLGGIAWIGSHELDPFRRPDDGRKPLPVQVVSLDWKWLFIYPEQGLASVNELVLPAGTTVEFSLTSASVMNAFFVPQLGGMIYTMNGMQTKLHLKADREGEFEGLSAHFSGDGFPDMRFKVRSVAEPDFARWVETARGSADKLDQGAYERLARPSLGAPVATFRDPDPHLFGDILTQAIAPAPGPEGGQPTPDVSHRTGG